MELYSQLVGVSFRGHDARTTVQELEIDDEVQLEAEPDNEYDIYAVKVLVDGQHVGYLARGTNAEVAEALSLGEEPTAKVISFESSLKPSLLISW